MLKCAAAFFIIALASGVVGFGGIGGLTAGIAEFLAITFLIAFGASLAVHPGRRPRPQTGGGDQTIPRPAVRGCTMFAQTGTT